jgi:hypothetical protein
MGDCTGWEARCAAAGFRVGRNFLHNYQRTKVDAAATGKHDKFGNAQKVMRQLEEKK